MKKLVWNDVKQNRLISAATIFFMAVSAALLVLTALLLINLLGAVDGLMDKAVVPDFMQMHTGEVDETELVRFAESRLEVRDWQICRFLNLDNSRIVLGGHNMIDSTQDNGLSVQSGRFDLLLGMDGGLPDVLAGDVYVPACYRARYDLAIGEEMRIGDQTLIIAGFIRDAQMNSMMASSKRFLVSTEDYEKLRGQGQEEYLIEFLLWDRADINDFQSAYTAQGLPADGPAITRPLIRMVNALSDGTMIFVIFLVSVIVLSISVICIHFILSLQMERDRKEVGMLKALGIGKREIRRIYFAKYLLFSACGILAGVTAAAVLQKPLIRQLQELYGITDNGVQAGIASLLAALLAEGIILLSIRQTLKKTDKLSALEALFQNRKKGSDRKQYFLIGIVTAACTFLMLVPKNLYNTLSSPAFVTYMGIGNGEIRMDVRQGGDIGDVTARVVAALEKDMRVEKYVVLRTGSFPALLPDGSTAGLIVETGDHLVFPVSYSTGTAPAGDSDIALSSLNAEELGLSVGDTLRLSVNGEEKNYRVCGIYSDITNGGKTAKISGGEKQAAAIWSVLYVSLNKSADKGRWMEQYRAMGADVTDLADYVRNTYAQTLTQIYLASQVAAGIAVLVITVVLLLFLRLIVERNRYTISLYKALGFTGGELERSCFRRGFFPAVSGIAAGLVLGNLWGGALCGMILKSFGADGFRFVIDWGQVLAKTAVPALGSVVFAIWGGISGIRLIKAHECCTDNE